MRPSMKICAECHGAKMDDCRFCHVGASLPSRKGKRGPQPR